MKEGSTDEVEGVEESVEADQSTNVSGREQSKQLTPEALSSMAELQRRSKERGTGQDEGWSGGPNWTALQESNKKAQELLEAQRAAASRLRPDESTTITSSDATATSGESSEIRSAAPLTNGGARVSPAFDAHELPLPEVVQEEPQWITEEELAARRPKKKESLISKGVKKVKNKTSAAAGASVRAVGKATEVSARALIDTTDWYADTAKRVGKAAAEQARADSEKLEATLRAQYAESPSETGTPASRERLHTSYFVVGDGNNAPEVQNETGAEAIEQKTEIPIEELEHRLADGVAAETQRRTLEEILNSPDGAAFADLLDRKGINPDEIEIDSERLHTQFEAFRVRESVSEQVHNMLGEMLINEPAPVGSGQKESIGNYIEHAVAYYPEEVVKIQEVFGQLDAHKAQVEEYRKTLASSEADMLSQMSIYVASETPLPANVHDMFKDGFRKQVSEISIAELDDRERTFTLALSGSKGHKGWKEPVLSWMASFVTRDYPTADEKKAIEKLAYEYASDAKYASIQDRCKEELRNIATLREIKKQNDKLVAERTATVDLVKKQMARQLKGTEVWQVALAESARETAKISLEELLKSPKDISHADRQAVLLQDIDRVSSNLAFNLGSEMPIKELRAQVVERMKLMRAAELRKVLIETPIGTGGFDSMFASIDALVASPEIGRHNNEQAVAHIYQSVQKIAEELPGSRGFYARTALLKLRAKYGDMVDAKVEESTPPAKPQTESVTPTAPTEQAQESASSDEIVPSYAPFGMMDDEEHNASNKNAKQDAEPVLSTKQENNYSADEFLRALEERLTSMEQLGQITADQAAEKRRVAALVEKGFSNNPVHDAELFAMAGISDEKKMIDLFESRDIQAVEPSTYTPPGENKQYPIRRESEQSVGAAAEDETRTTTAVEISETLTNVERHAGDKVKVLSPRGVIESGWVITDIDKDTKVAIAHKEGAQRRTKRTELAVPLEMLNSWQQFSDEETLTLAFTNAKTPEELNSAFETSHGIWEGGTYYSSIELTNLLGEAIGGHTSTNKIPNIAGLRGIVRALIAEHVPIAPAVPSASTVAPEVQEVSAAQEVPEVQENVERNIDEQEFARRLRKVKTFDQLSAVLSTIDNVATKKADFSRAFLEKQMNMALTDKKAKWVPTVGGYRVLVARLFEKKSLQS